MAHASREDIYHIRNLFFTATGGDRHQREDARRWPREARGCGGAARGRGRRSALASLGAARTDAGAVRAEIHLTLLSAGVVLG